MKLSKLLSTILVTGLLVGCGHTESKHAVYFDSGSDRLSANDMKALKEVAQIVKQREADKLAVEHLSSDTRIRLSGYSDRVGDKEMNKTLAKKRMEAVNKELIRLGVKPTFISKAAIGEGLLMDKTGPDNQDRRRVDIHID